MRGAGANGSGDDDEDDEERRRKARLRAAAENASEVLLVARSGRDAIVSGAAALAIAVRGARDDAEGGRPLRAGDLLRTTDGEEAVVGGIADAVVGGDIAWPGRGGRARVYKVADAAERLERRSVGQYSRLTRRPLGGKTGAGAQEVGAGAMAELIRRGATALAEELWTVRSDDGDGAIGKDGRAGLTRRSCAAIRAPGRRSRRWPPTPPSGGRRTERSGSRTT